jgi:Fe2+ transport system protein FeoA
MNNVDCLKLSELVCGESATIVKVDNVSRLITLGFVKNGAVSKIKTAPFGGSAEYNILSSRVVMRDALADHITVCR